MISDTYQVACVHLADFDIYIQRIKGVASIKDSNLFEFK